MTKGSLIEYQALKIAKLEQEIESYRAIDTVGVYRRNELDTENQKLRLAIAWQLYVNSGGCVEQLRATAAEFGITPELAYGLPTEICAPAEHKPEYADLIRKVAAMASHAGATVKLEVTIDPMGHQSFVVTSGLIKPDGGNVYVNKPTLEETLYIAEDQLATYLCR